MTLLLLLAHSNADSGSPVGWQSVTQENGISVYKRSVPDVDVIEFKGSGIIEATVAKVMGVLLDSPRSVEWADGLEKCYVLERKSPLHYVEYDHFATPFIIKDRDLVLEVTTEIDVAKKEVRIHQKSVESKLMPETSYVRAQLIRALFALKPIDQGKHTLFEGEILIDPKGSMPKWLFNFFQESWPRTTLESLRKQVLKADIKEHPSFINLFKSTRSGTR